MRKLAFGREEIAGLIAAHEEFRLAGQQHLDAVRLGAAWNDRHVKPVFRVSNVDQRLIVPNLTLSSASAGSAQAVIVANAATIAERGRTAAGRLWAKRFTENTSRNFARGPSRKEKARCVIANPRALNAESRRLFCFPCLAPPARPAEPKGKRRKGQQRERCPTAHDRGSASDGP
jgi:hypothetical protein